MVELVETLNRVIVTSMWRKRVRDNIANGSKWYYGLPYGWWWGRDMKGFFKALPEHLDHTVEPNWFPPHLRHVDYPLSPSGENYNSLYHMADYKGKTVLDIGADYGSSACWFLVKGAKQVIAVEKNESHFIKLKEYADALGQDMIIPVKMTVNKKQNYETLLSTYKPEVAKLDCEGCEQHLLKVDDKTFSIPDQYIIEAHSVYLTSDFLAKLKKSYKAKIVIEYHPPWCNIIYATRK